MSEIALKIFIVLMFSVMPISLVLVYFYGPVWLIPAVLAFVFFYAG